MRRLPTVGDDENLNESASWLAGVLPDAVALRGLSVEVRGPETVTLGEPARFHVSIRNRLPLPVSVTLPTSQLWGWQVDGVPEADERGYEPPETERTVVFHRGERKVFSTTWDGRVRRNDDEENRRSDGEGEESAAREAGDVWVDREGPCRFTGYLVADRWEERGLYDRTEVVVRE